MFSMDFSTCGRKHFDVKEHGYKIRFSAFIAAALFVWAQDLARAESGGRGYEVELTAKGPFESVGILAIDKLRVGEENALRIRVVNRTGADVYLGNPGTTCSCLSVKSEREILPDGEHCIVEMNLKPGRDYGGTIWSQTIAFNSGAGEKNRSYVTVTVRANLQGVFVVKPERLVFVANQGGGESEGRQVVEREVSLITTPPVRFEGIKIHGSPLLELFDIDPAAGTEGRDTATVRIKIASKDIPESGLHGLLIFSDVRSGQSRRIPVSAIKRQAVRVVPARMIVQRSDVEGVWAAHGMLIDQHPSREADIAVSVEASIGGIEVPVVVESKGRRIKRLKMQLEQDLLDRVFASGNVQNCEFAVLWGATKSVCNCKIQFVNQSHETESPK